MDNGESSYRRFLDGDTGGFDELVNMYHDALIYFINGFLFDITESEDVAEDTFMELIVHPKRFSFRSSLKTYIFQIARNKAIDRVRKRKRISSTPIDETDIEDTESIENSVLKDERSKMLHIALGKINEEYATLLRLVYFEDMTAEEAGRVLKKNKRQIANLMYRAKGSLKRAMEEEGFSYEES